MSETAVPERFVPADSRGQLVEAEHLVRYSWAARFARGRRVLDAACGTAYGSRMLSEAGAASVVGVDRAAGVLDAVRAECPENVELVVGDLAALPLPDRSFDLVVCFETIEHVETPDVALRELARVVAPDGVVLISSPNRDVYEPGNPHHIREYTPRELREALERYFAHVELRRQSNLIVSAVMTDEVAERTSSEPVDEVRLAKCVAVEPGSETYTIARASHSPLPPDETTDAVATGITEVRRWLELYATQQQVLEDQYARLEEAAAAVADAREALLERELAEARANRIADDLANARDDNLALQQRIDALEERVRRAAEAMEGIKRSPSWRITAPLRALKRRRGG